MYSIIYCRENLLYSCATILCPTPSKIPFDCYYSYTIRIDSFTIRIRYYSRGAKNRLIYFSYNCTRMINLQVRAFDEKITTKKKQLTNPYKLAVWKRRTVPVPIRYTADEVMLPFYFPFVPWETVYPQR